MIPLVGYLSGDFIPLLFLADASGTVGQMAESYVVHVADVRVPKQAGPIAVEFDGRRLDDPDAIVSDVGIGPMDVVYFAYA